MGYDFFVFPSEAADGLDRALQVYESSPDRGLLTPGGRMAEFLAALEADGLRADGLRADGLRAEARGHDGAARVQTSWDDPRANLRVVAGLARPHGLSVLDVQLTALYDPRGAVDVALDTEAGPSLPFVTRPVLREVLSHLVERRYSWLTLTGSGAARASYDGHAFDVGVDGTVTRHDDARLVEELLWSWAATAEAEV
jgi:hypothetical protein